MRYGVSMLQVVRVHPEPVEGRSAVKLLGGLARHPFANGCGSTSSPWAEGLFAFQA